MPSSRPMSFVGMLPDICKVLQCLLHTSTHSCGHIESASVADPYACGCFGPSSLGQDHRALLQGWVMVQESTSGPVRVYVHVSSSPKERGEQPLAFCLSVCLPGFLTGGVRETTCQLVS